MNIAFDLDGIFIDKPPFIPKTIIERLYRNNGTKISYRIPGKFEQVIRKISHRKILRPPIGKNVNALKKLHKLNLHKFYLISGRFGFLQKETENILKTHRIHKFFEGKFLNIKNTQPHLFKNRMLKKLKIHTFADDDLELLKFLAKRNKKIQFFWVNKKEDKSIAKNLTAINNLLHVINK